MDESTGIDDQSIRFRQASGRFAVVAAYRLLTGGQFPDALSVDEFDRFPVEPPVGTVLRFLKSFSRPGPDGTTRYTYLALRVDDRWYLTGTKGRDVMGWDDLKDLVGDSPCSMATEWAEIPQPPKSPYEEMTPAEWHRAVYGGEVTVPEAEGTQG